jgi:hypothetical protein
MLNALLQDSGKNATALILPDGGDNDERLQQAIELRKKWMIAHGQSQQMHACKVCERFIPSTGHNSLCELRLAFSILYLQIKQIVIQTLNQIRTELQYSI